MSTRAIYKFSLALLFSLVLAFLLMFVLDGLPATSVEGAALAANGRLETPGEEPGGQLPASSPPKAPCPGGPTIDGILLDECFVENFTVGGDNKSITVWYTKVQSNATRIVDGNPMALTHWITTDAQAQQIAAWGRQAWERYHEVFGRHPYDTGCGDNINVRIEDGPNWSGIAYWYNPCWIGIDAPMVRNGGGQWTVYHEFQHYMQRAYDSGCFAQMGPGYPGNAEYVEGYADVAADGVDAVLDSIGFANAVGNYNPAASFFDKSYGDVYLKYYIEQVGSLWTPADPHHHMDAIRDHYLECDVQDDLYVWDTLIPTLRPGLSEEKLFLNFFAANWAKDWADPVTQPELVYTDDDGNPYGSIALAQNVALAGGSQNWNGQTTPDDWAGLYYQVRPQAGCDYVTLAVDGAAGARLGINLMAADTTPPTSVSRAAWMGEDLTRTFGGAGVHNRVVAAVNAFDSQGNYDVTFTCVTPTLDILEPKQTHFVLVGSPASPISFLARFKVTSAGTPVRGLPATSFSAEAEGDPVAIVPGSFQEVGEEYWVVMTPPVKPDGTTFVDLRICLDTAICDTESDALLYVAPGNTDFALVFDASGSMNTEDVIGEGQRVENARKAGTVLADSLKNGDRIAVTDFSAHDNPPGCGLPAGDGNCELDLQTYLARTDVTVPNTINDAKAAIGLISGREWTPIGAALVDAKDKLQAAPYSLSPKHVILLSDGLENVNPLYNDVRDELVASGVVIDTIAFSGEADQALMARIAADTNGTYRFVPTTTPGVMVTAGATQLDKLLSLGVPSEVISRLTAAFLPGPLGLDDVYDYYETKGQDAARLFNSNQIAVPYSEWREVHQFVDGSVTELRLVVASKQFDSEKCEGSSRSVQVLPPGANPEQGWIPISPPSISNPPPPTWDIRNSGYDDVVIIPNPAVGSWGVRAQYFSLVCITGEADRRAPDLVAAQAGFDFMLNGSVQSDIRLQGRFLAPIVNNQGRAGDKVPIVATLLTRAGALPGSTVVAAIEKPGAIHFLLLRDDGQHSDGAAGDGIYGAYYSQTDVGGTYNVRLIASAHDPGTGQLITREWLGAFWIERPEAQDGDADGMPDIWEQHCGPDTNRNDAQDDPDHDGLTNIEEFHLGTLPCDPDTDHGGERDGSEVANGRDPLDPADDLCSPLGHINAHALNQGISIAWPRPGSFTSMALFVSTVPGQLGQSLDMGVSGRYTLTNLINEQTYYLTLAGANGLAQCDYSDPIPVTPKADPDAPSGAILINNGAPTTKSKNVTLYIGAADDPLPGVPQGASSSIEGSLPRANNTVSGVVEMKVSNHPFLSGAVWEPFVSRKPWKLGDSPSAVHQVFAQFRDAAGNESFIVSDDILVLTPTAITLASFEASASESEVRLAWETAAEIDNEGFNVWRAEAADGEYTRLNPSLIPAEGDPDTGASYEYVDSDVVKGMAYYYKLEDVDLHGVSTFHGPVSATAGPIHPLYLPLIVK
jgi:hypothetical protein